MRVAILAHSFSAALRVYNDVCSVCDCAIVLSPSPHRSTLVSVSANLARIASYSTRAAGLVASHRVVLLRHQFDHPQSIEKLRRLSFDVGLHQSGIIYRKNTIESFRLGILNSHIGLLPAYRGRSVMEWALIQGDNTGITVFFVDEGIDTGERIVISEPVDVSHCTTLAEGKQYLFDLSGDFYRRALERLETNEGDFKLNDSSGRRYYVMSNLFTRVAEQALVMKN